MTGTVRVELDGVSAEVPAAVSVAAALAAAGRAPAIFCGMGACQECVLTVDGVSGVRACVTPVAAGMRIETRDGSEGRG